MTALLASICTITFPDHSFECSTISGEQEKVSNAINTIKSTYDQFSKVHNTSNIIKHVTVRRTFGIIISVSSFLSVGGNPSG